MRRMVIALVAALAVGGVGASAAAADKPPFPYADCVSAARKNGESAGHAKWHCDQLVKKGWVKRPKAT